MVYKAENLEEFEELAGKILRGEAESLTEQGYEVARKRDIGTIGARLVEVYEQAEEIRRKNGEVVVREI